MHKGFKCLDPKEGRVYISRDVVFDESVFPFSSLHPNAGANFELNSFFFPCIYMIIGVLMTVAIICVLLNLLTCLQVVQDMKEYQKKIRCKMILLSGPHPVLALILTSVGPAGTAGDPRWIHLESVQHLVPDRLRDRCL
jgi:hypothetical protein